MTNIAISLINRDKLKAPGRHRNTHPGYLPLKYMRTYQFQVRSTAYWDSDGRTMARWWFYTIERRHGNMRIRRSKGIRPRFQIESWCLRFLYPFMLLKQDINTMFSMHGNIKKYIPINPVAFSVHQDLWTDIRLRNPALPSDTDLQVSA